jgi:hypothetical protein
MADDGSGGPIMTSPLQGFARPVARDETVPGSRRQFAESSSAIDGISRSATITITMSHLFALQPTLPIARGPGLRDKSKRSVRCSKQQLLDPAMSPRLCVKSTPAKYVHVAFRVVNKEDEDAYQWLIQMLDELREEAGACRPSVAITDFERALKNALSNV